MSIGLFQQYKLKIHSTLGSHNKPKRTSSSISTKTTVVLVSTAVQQPESLYSIFFCKNIY